MAHRTLTIMRHAEARRIDEVAERRTSGVDA